MSHVGSHSPIGKQIASTCPHHLPMRGKDLCTRDGTIRTFITGRVHPIPLYLGGNYWPRFVAIATKYTRNTIWAVTMTGDVHLSGSVTLNNNCVLCVQHDLWIKVKEMVKLLKVNPSNVISKLFRTKRTRKRRCSSVHSLSTLYINKIVTWFSSTAKFSSNFLVFASKFSMR